ncbi:hypothetical protein HID58_053712 [Brassica napus]|uniref:Uncharacterized protein n=1 Tax=Brassica napus TaxID=3708 RepID=A0ABQ8AFW8_BRANA|nr:hypothetical protein HID58_053712 [Brassica napus]
MSQRSTRKGSKHRPYSEGHISAIVFPFRLSSLSLSIDIMLYPRTLESSRVMYITSVKHKERGLFCNPSLKRTILSLQRDLFHLDAPLILSSTQWISFRDRIHKLTKELSVEIHVSFFEEANNAHYNSVSIGYVDEVTSVFIGSCIYLMDQSAICWDQRFPEEARAMVLHGDEYCFISLPLAVNFKTRDWIRVIIGVESRKGMMEIMWDMRNKLHPQPQTAYNLSNASICAFVSKAFFFTGLLSMETTIALSISKGVLKFVECEIERYITLNIVCSWVTNGLSLKLKDDLLKPKNRSLESVKTESKEHIRYTRLNQSSLRNHFTYPGFM